MPSSWWCLGARMGAIMHTARPPRVPASLMRHDVLPPHHQSQAPGLSCVPLAGWHQACPRERPSTYTFGCRVFLSRRTAGAHLGVALHQARIDSVPDALWPLTARAHPLARDRLCSYLQVDNGRIWFMAQMMRRTAARGVNRVYSTRVYSTRTGSHDAIAAARRLCRWIWVTTHLLEALQWPSA